jgi:acetyltransferase-like isoleucine patch superfamily enzyme
MKFKQWKPPHVEHGKLTQYNWLVQHPENLFLGFQTDIGAFTYINAEKGVTIEDFVQIGSHCSLFSISTIDNKEGSILLRRNCRIGTHSVIMPGVIVGANSIVGAFSFVNRDIPENVLAFGTPAKVIRPMTDEEIQRNEPQENVN